MFFYPLTFIQNLRNVIFSILQDHINVIHIQRQTQNLANITLHKIVNPKSIQLYKLLCSSWLDQECQFFKVFFISKQGSQRQEHN